jgi:hypothetical protein
MIRKFIRNLLGIPPINELRKFSKLADRNVEELEKCLLELQQNNNLLIKQNNLLKDLIDKYEADDDWKKGKTE